MKFGLNPQQYQFIMDQVVKPLQSHGAQVWCFGSRARGDQKTFSDLDIMVDSKSDLSDLIGAIDEVLIESNFPYKVDIVELRNFATAYLKNYESEKILFSN